MYKIGDFSKITNLTVKALRYYDGENILNPSYRCEENSYRFYDDTDFKKAELIVLLRELNFSISRAISTIHTGTYESFNMAYKAIFDYAKEKNISCLAPSREIYIKGPGMIFKGNPKNYITKIIIPIQ